jgi:hypothetical protein
MYPQYWLPKLREHLGAAVAYMTVSPDYPTFIKMLDTHRPRFHDQLELPFEYLRMTGRGYNERGRQLRRPKAVFGGDGGAPLRDDGAKPLPSRRIQGPKPLRKIARMMISSRMAA